MQSITPRFMPRVSAFSIAQNDIEKFFDQYQGKLLSNADLEEIFNVNRDFWRLPQSWHYYKFIRALEGKTDHLRTVTLEFPRRKIERYFWKEVDRLQVALSVSPKAYISHYTAIAYHNLTDQVPKNIYVTTEQSPKSSDWSLTQKGIDAAFAKEQRKTENYSPIPSGTLYWLKGKHTKRAGVIKTEDGIPITNIERTLIDATVRPLYSGGIYEVLEAFTRAADVVSVNKLAATLRKIGFIYPYHQAIGFYLERSGAYRPAQLDLLRKFDKEYDFYLTYNMKDKEYSKDWRLYYPKGF